ncbi:hypothetical protein GTP41_26740 [Pseudoduganella sp. DS3]|uniref:Uncharacterized protein n=1 Tax=Pseudoduganella guangdongensis TaxID=2692179 RepID=A0A6N9HRP4_9BURK|nr:hypothetical protein [Pseudoduganella guangdongensis]MYN05692.1 hypothetical protein [Pseudoduganella guangdongensis]
MTLLTARGRLYRTACLTAIACPHLAAFGARRAAPAAPENPFTSAPPAQSWEAVAHASARALRSGNRARRVRCPT